MGKRKIPITERNEFDLSNLTSKSRVKIEERVGSLAFNNSQFFT
jgi:hypothetical protein